MVEGVLRRVRGAVARKLAAAARACRVGYDDLNQEALLAACRAARTWRPERGPFERYAMAAALTHIDLLCRRASAAKRRGETATLPAGLVAPPPPPDPRRVAELLATLTPEEREGIGGDVRRAVYGRALARVIEALGED
jgi:DNA-directed RNA polymerase specialized sigma24 family protein